MIRVMLADDDLTLREGLYELLELSDVVTVVGLAENGAEAVKVAVQLRPDVLVMDLAMPVMDGMEAAWQLYALAPQIKVLFLSGRSGYCIRHGVPASVQGFVIKTDVVEELDLAIQAVHHGELYLSSHHITGPNGEAVLAGKAWG
jgi:DNA-binding NarL/FixJ family response regulator